MVSDTEEVGDLFLDSRLGYYPIADLSAGLLRDITTAERDVMIHPA